ncbi:uncharacterized protein PSANT_05725 [Moesziomyces antarcticus]|uniref:Uncharacterized protein n=1 Tax=Pseudozyma antarctica TaxID=84753 RepID=A0A5C3FWT8_PSEA2|nr:uncharacterized protein PSANT_05725 [Moesziomyces antarcticus]
MWRTGEVPNGPIQLFAPGPGQLGVGPLPPPARCPSPALLSVARPAVRRLPYCPSPALLLSVAPLCVATLATVYWSGCSLLARLTADRCWETSAEQGKIFHTVHTWHAQASHSARPKSARLSFLPPCTIQHNLLGLPE